MAAAGSPSTAQVARSTTNGSSRPPAQLLTIGEVARRSGFTIKALRFYERRGLLPPASRRPSGYRLYGEADLHRLEFIRQAKALGLTLDAIRPLVVAAREAGHSNGRDRLVRMLDERITQTAGQIATLARLRRELRRRRAALARGPRREPGHGYCTCLHDRGGKTGGAWSRQQSRKSSR